ncbi:hypothetical protein ABT389_07775 [Streptomyces bacillaris]|uniref:hypothetical protein n=1 Tax=Streptomyces bacillaris TaxID=68179 RepID=UPI00336047A2
MVFFAVVEVGNCGVGVAQECGKLGGDALVAVGVVEHRAVVDGLAEAPQVRFFLYPLAVRVGQSHGWGEGGAELDQVDPVRVLSPSDGLWGVRGQQGRGGHVQRTGEGVQGLHADGAALFDLAYGAR